MLPPDLSSRGYDLLWQQCCDRNGNALAELSKFPPDDPLCAWVIKQSIAGNASATQVLLWTAESSPGRIFWNEQRHSAIERWKLRHADTVRRIFRYRLKPFPDEVNEGVQGFWVWFFETCQDAKYNPDLKGFDLAGEQGDPVVIRERRFISNLANRRALDYFRMAMSTAVRFPAFPENFEPEERGNAGGAADPEDTAAVVRYFYAQIITNKVPVHAAILRLCSALAGLGPTELTRGKLHLTLYDLCERIETALEPEESSESQKMIAALRHQLAMPVEQALGNRSLAELLEGRRNGQDRRYQEREQKRILQYWVDQAKRSLDPGSGTAGAEQRRALAGEATQRIEEDTRRRLEFLKRAVRQGVSGQVGLVWALRTVYRLPPEYISNLRCRDAAKILVDRVSFVAPTYSIFLDHETLLCGACIDVILAHRLSELAISMERAVRTTEARYRADGEKEVCL
jgi:hypothetical protein